MRRSTTEGAPGTSSATLPGNTTIRAAGPGVAVGRQAFVQGGRIQGEAPDLPGFSVAV